MVKKIWLGITLALVILTASFYILMPEKVRIDFEKTRTIFKIFEDDKFIISGIEYVRLFDGTTLMRAKNRTINYIISDSKTIVKRISSFKDEIIIEDLYQFNNEVANVENVPVSHKICFTNAKNKIFEYMIDRIEYDGETKDITSPFSFGKNMKLTFQDGYYRAKVYNYKYASDKIKIRYRITEDYQCFDVRFFDPIIGGLNITKLCEWKTIKDVKICDKKIGYKINNKIINCTKYGYGCDNKETEVCVWYCLDGDCKTKLDFDYVKSRINETDVGGWSGKCFDVKDANWHKVKMKLDSPTFKDIVIENE